jgi:hypothetical protein
MGYGGPTRRGRSFVEGRAMVVLRFCLTSPRWSFSGSLQVGAELLNALLLLGRYL